MDPALDEGRLPLVLRRHISRSDLNSDRDERTDECIEHVVRCDASCADELQIEPVADDVLDGGDDLAADSLRLVLH